jgi:hypothetical protein
MQVLYKGAYWESRGTLLFKAPKYDRTQIRKDEKGRSWAFNNETNRWRIQRGEEAKQPKQGADKQPADAPPKQGKSGLSQRIGSAIKKNGGSIHVDALHQHLDKKKPIAREDLAAHLDGLVKRGKLHTDGDGNYSRSPISPTPKDKPTEPRQSSAITLQPKAKSQESPKNPVDAVSDRYASGNPSDADISGWINDVAIASTAPDDASDHAATLKHHSLMNGVDPGKVKNREGWAKAVYAKEQRGKKERGGKELSADDFSFWDSSQEKALNDAQKKAANPKASEAGRAKAAKLAEKLAAEKERDRKSAEAAAAQSNQTRGGDRKTRVAALLKEYDDHFGKLKAERQGLHTRVKKGDKRAIAEAAHNVIKEMDHYAPVRGNRKQGDRDAVKEHLQQFHNKNGGDAKILGMSKGRDFTMQELKSAYRQASRSAHPDKGGSEQQFQAVSDAYQRLKSKAKLAKSVSWLGMPYRIYWTGDRVVLRRGKS